MAGFRYVNLSISFNFSGALGAVSIGITPGTHHNTHGPAVDCGQVCM